MPIPAVTASGPTAADKRSAKTYNAIRNFATQYGLCIFKAALPSDAWQQRECIYERYQGEI